MKGSFVNIRRHLGQVTRFRAETDHAHRWLSYALQGAEKGFRRIINGHGWLPLLMEALKRSLATTT